MRKKGKKTRFKKGIKFTVASAGQEGAGTAATPPQELKPQRRFPRVPAETSIIVRSLDGNVKGELSKTKVVGRGGLCFVQEKKQGIGSTLFLSIQVGWDLVEARVRVVYEAERGPSEFEVGVEFEEVTAGGLEILEKLLEKTGVDADGDPRNR